MVNQLLVNEKYIGNNVWARTSFKLGVRLVRTPACEWVRFDGAFEAIVDPLIFARAGAIVAARSERFTDEDMLDQLRSILAANGSLSSALIDECEHSPFSTTYNKRFGSLLKAYALVGFRSRRDYRYLENARHLRAFHRATLNDAADGVRATGGTVAHDPATDLLTINDEFTVAVVVGRCYRTEAGSHRWKIRLGSAPRADLIILVRMAGDNEQILDYYILPMLDTRGTFLRLYRDNGASLDAYRFTSLAPLYRMAARAPVRRAA